VLALLAQVDLPSLGQEGPDDIKRLLAIFFVLMGLGFLVATLGHLFKVRLVVGMGLALIFIATAFFMVAVGKQA
jgi:hypothetical protein